MQTPNMFMLGFIVVFCIQTAIAKITVSPNGSGDFLTISEAIMASPSYSKNQIFIYIKAGIYNETVVVGSEKTNLVMIGEGKDNTIITGDKSYGSGYRTTNTTTVSILGVGFVAHDITIENTAGPLMSQAVALKTEADMLTFYRCRILGFQDTLYAHKGYQFFRNCEIWGTVDFICGYAKVVFQACTIYVRNPLPGQSNTITAQKRELANGDSGIVIMYSNITATDDLRQQIPMVKTYLGRPWGPYAVTVIMDSFLDSIIEPEGWLEWDNLGNEPVYYAEYQNVGPGADTTRRVAWSKVITNPTEGNQFTVRNFIRGDKWIPQQIPHFPDLVPQLQVSTTSDVKRRLAKERLMNAIFLIFVICFLFEI